MKIEARELFSQNWTFQKSDHRFSKIPFDQVHEQQNNIIKGKGGIVGLTENTDAMTRWLLCAPELSCMINEFEEKNFLKSFDHQQYNHHHTETLAEQLRIQKKTKALIDVIDELGNPFEETHQDLLTLDTRDWSIVSVIQSFDSLKSVGRQQYK